MVIETCPLCGADDSTVFFTTRDVPIVSNRLAEDEEAARAAPVGDVELAVCRACALIWNRAFEPASMTYGPDYENPLHFSSQFRSYADSLASELVARHDLSGRHVVEIGCGDGHMLDLMVKHGAATATGFDPSMAGRMTAFTGRAGVEIIPEYFSSASLDRLCDAMLLRQVLEHLDTPMSCLQEIRRAMGERRGCIYIEVPNADWMLETVSVCDVIYEHVTYWTGHALETLLRRTGFRPLRIQPAYGGQFLQAEGVTEQQHNDILPGAVASITEMALAFGVAAEAKLGDLRRLLSDGSGPAVLWGAGSKGITFANFVSGVADVRLVALVDLNPRKHGLRVPGVALPVVGPEALREIRPELVIIANAIYVDEIRDKVRELGLDPAFEIVAG